MKYMCGSCGMLTKFKVGREIIKSTAMVMVGRSVHLTTLFPGQAK